MRVLVAVEDEQFGSAIIDFVTAHVWHAGTIFRLVHVVEQSSVGDKVTAIYGSGIDNEILEQRTKRGSALLNKLRDTLQPKVGSLNPVEVTVLFGRPHHAILETAEEWKADMIVVGSHGRKGLSRFLLGSVSLSVVTHADCTVIIVRLPKPAESETEGEAAKAGQKREEKAEAVPQLEGTR